jgi:aryl-alcohol dehydrogenase-like predicted oxidoreductase
MEQIEFVKSGLMTSRIGIGTWAMGGAVPTRFSRARRGV